MKLNFRAWTKKFLKGFPQDFLRTVGEGKCEVISDTLEYTEFHVKSCRFLELTKELGCPEICSVFCELDTLMYTDMHPNLLYNRDKTLYNGDGCCNFSMRYVENKEEVLKLKFTGGKMRLMM